MRGRVVQRLDVLEDGDRNEAGFSGDVPAHHQDHPELPEGMGEAEDAAGDESPSGHGYRHREEGVEASGAKRGCRFEGPPADRLERALDRLHHERKGSRSPMRRRGPSNENVRDCPVTEMRRPPRGPPGPSMSRR